MSRTSPIYRAAVQAGLLLAPVAAAVSDKAARGHRRRAGAAARLARWAAAERDPRRPLVWMHAPSVGEGLQAASVLAALRSRVPAVQVVYTHFSPSAERFARHVGADAADYLPYDTPAAATLLLDTLRPDLLVFAKLDLWPELASAAGERGVPVALVAATVRPHSGRLRRPARALLRPGYEAVTAAAAVSPGDRERLVTLGVPAECIRIVGDPRADSVLSRISAIPHDAPLLRYGAGAPTLVAGSTWPPDEDVLLNAFARLRRREPGARLILVPHEPTERHIARIFTASRRFGLPRPVRLSAADEPAPLLLVDRVGALATIYGAGVIAYVGGGFGRAGLHSVLEPAAWRLPVVFGPEWGESRDARLLIDARAAAGLSERDPVGQLLRWWSNWLSDEISRAETGGRAYEAVVREAGASGRTAAILADLLPAQGATTVPS
jgi:3-deoxy-D-manno-octulosonic-acid transferase